MSDVRRSCWETFRITGLQPTLITPANLEQWIVPEHPLHPAYEFLSPVHRSDYLRPYFMFHHGGGYADIKRQGGSWLQGVDRVLSSSRLAGAGYREVRGGTVWLQNNPVDGHVYVLSRSAPRAVATLITNAMRGLHFMMIGNCAFYFKPHASYVKHWLAEVERRLDILLPSLRKHPANGLRNAVGDGSGYPVPWSFLLGDITGPLSLTCCWKLTRDLPPPIFRDYQ